MSGSRIFVAIVACLALLSSFPHGDEGAGRPAIAQPKKAASDQALRRSVGLVNRHLAERWKMAGVKPARNTNQYELIRRVTLDLAGRVPSVGEVEAFVADKRPRKRELLVDRLLASEDYADRFADLYMDLMIGRELRFGRQFATARDYFLEAFRSNKPMDQLATDLITATGDLRDNGAVGYILAQRLRGGSIETLAGTTSRNFLGVQIQCAQCHDHPSDDRYRQDDFVRFAAYFSGIHVRAINEPSGERSVHLSDRPNLPYSPAKRAVTRARKRAAERGRKPYIIEPRFFGRQTPPRAAETRRQVLARTIVQSELFAKVTVNRTWGLLLGRPLVAPWDDLGGEGDDNHPALLDQLALDFATHGYDHKRLVKVIVMSSAYQRASIGGTAPDGATDPDRLLEVVYARAQVRPLSASQLFYSQLLASGIDQAARGMNSWKVERRVEAALREYVFTFADDEGNDSDTFTGSVPQALLLRNGALSNQGSRAGPGMVLDRILNAAKQPGKRLHWMFLAAYGRPPTKLERQRLLAHIKARGDTPKAEREAYEDIYHALLTSTEFVTNH